MVTFFEMKPAVHHFSFIIVKIVFKKKMLRQLVS